MKKNEIVNRRLTQINTDFFSSEKRNMAGHL